MRSTRELARTTPSRENWRADDLALIDARDPHLVVARELVEPARHWRGSRREEPTTAFERGKSSRLVLVLRSKRRIDRDRVDRLLRERHRVAHNHRHTVSTRRSFRRVQENQLS